MLNYERVNQLSGICLDEQIPLAWVDNHVLISQDMSMAVGLKIAYPDTLFVSSVQIDELHNEFTSMLNQLALLDDTETRLQFVTICHNQYGQMIDDYMMEMPRENQLLSQFKRDLGQHYVEKLQAGELRRYPPTCSLASSQSWSSPSASSEFAGTNAGHPGWRAFPPSSKTRWSCRWRTRPASPRKNGTPPSTSCPNTFNRPRPS